ncbi:MAG: single-stranded-DNA-specific exonuclease RecJ [Actinomycetota bacterium]|nr:single-stranded-DNA-specific exonuclease RecJ [Actinomycetota bacterium]
MIEDRCKEKAPAEARWRLAPADEVLVAGLSADTGLSRFVSRILVVRGLGDAEAMRRFLEPDLDRDWHDPSLIPGMDDAAERVAAAVRGGERIVVFGDFDLDGVSSAAVAARGLAAFGASVQAIVPNRFREGYGLTDASVARLGTMSPDVVVTVDCGISGAVEAQTLRASGVDIVVTDHHEPGDLVPVGVPIANPKLDSACVSRDLAGAGVALKLVQAVGRLFGKDDVWKGLIDLATLGTIADIVPLRGENRALVSEGLALMRRSPRVSVAALAAVSGVSIGTIKSDDISFSLAPRLNAAGRMADPSVALSLLMTDDPGQAEELARTLEEHNRVRQAVEQDLAEAAGALAERTYRPGDRALVLSGEGWHEGVKGIVASRLARLYGVPTFLFSIEGNEARGSGRSVGTVGLYDAVDSCSDVLIRFGGHDAAVGATVAPENLPRFRELLLGHLDSLPEEQFATELVADERVDLDDVSQELAAEIALLEPFGHENRRPLLAAQSVFMNARQRVGRTSSHLRFTAYDGTTSVQAIAFRCRDIEQMAAHDAAVDMVFEISLDEWRGRTRVQLLVRDIAPRERGDRSAAADLIEDLFEHAEEIIAREEYAGIEDADSFHTKLAGVTFEGRQGMVARLSPGSPLRLVRQPENPHDANAIAVYDPHGDHIGYLNRRLAAVLAAVIDAGVGYDSEVTEVTGGVDEKNRGVNVLLTRRGEPVDTDTEETAAERRAELAQLTGAQLDAALAREFIGELKLHDAQVRSLEVLARGVRCLTVMATGRGKSLIFQLHAARIALAEGAASVFVYPLRALVADQAFHLEEVFGRMGLRVCVLTGESSPSMRDETFAQLKEGEIDVVLTTPEFFDYHAARLAAGGRVRFVVVDEAHHVATSRSGHRPAYTRLGVALATLGTPTVLAVTATAGPEVAARVTELLGIEEVVTDPTVRDNLVVEDSRAHRDKDGYLVGLVARGEKTIVYVNSREQSVRLARMLRKRVPEFGWRIAFYNGGLSRSARHAVESAFRSGEVLVVIATSAFGEGVNIPDIRHVVLYHLPFNDIEFNQMCGRAGRDGARARIHTLFGPKDGKVNEMVLASVAPDREDMAALYLAAKELSSQSEDGWFEITNAELASRVCARLPRSQMNDRSVSSAIGVFRELGLVEGEGHGAYRRLALVPQGGGKVELESSVRYSEGLQEIEEFGEFRTWVLQAADDELLARFNRPILPSHS